MAQNSQQPPEKLWQVPPKHPDTSYPKTTQFCPTSTNFFEIVLF